METHLNEDEKRIRKGLYVLGRIEQIPFELDAQLKEKEHPDYLIMAYTEVKRMLNEVLCEAEKESESKN